MKQTELLPRILDVPRRGDGAAVFQRKGPTAGAVGLVRIRARGGDYYTPDAEDAARISNFVRSHNPDFHAPAISDVLRDLLRDLWEVALGLPPPRLHTVEYEFLE